MKPFDRLLNLEFVEAQLENKTACLTIGTQFLFLTMYQNKAGNRRLPMVAHKRFFAGAGGDKSTALWNNAS